MRFLLSTLLMAGFICQFSAQSDPGKKFYVTWGYTRAKYSKSNLHFVNHTNAYNPVTGRYDDYDFTLYDVQASDRPDFDKLKDVINITVPQYVFRIGMSTGRHTGFELNYDHTKYIVNDHQRVKIEGEFNDLWVKGDTTIDPEKFLHFEHSDGANFWMINYVRTSDLIKKKNLNVSLVLKPGAGAVIPRTDVTLFGQRLNNNWKVAGYIVGVETGVRIEFLRNGFFEFVGKTAYANYVNAFVLGKGHGKVNHQFVSGQLTATMGLRFQSHKTKP
jgi:hypothetical protein